MLFEDNIDPNLKEDTTSKSRIKNKIKNRQE